MFTLSKVKLSSIEVDRVWMGDHLRSMWHSNPAGVLLFFIDFQGGVVFEWRSNQEWRSITADTVIRI